MVGCVFCSTLHPRYNTLQYNADSVTNAVEVMDPNLSGLGASTLSPAIPFTY